MKIVKQERLLKVMPKQESVKIESFQGETHNSQIFVMSMNIKGLSIYEKAKATEKFINKETKVLEQVLETILRNYLRENGVIPYDGSNQALEKAFIELELKGKKIDVIDRYYEIGNERIVGESPNQMTIIEEDGILSCAMEIKIYERNDTTT